MKAEIQEEARKGGWDDGEMGRRRWASSGWLRMGGDHGSTIHFTTSWREVAC
jgi:hypothetical protein